MKINEKFFVLDDDKHISNILNTTCKGIKKYFIVQRPMIESATIRETYPVHQLNFKFFYLLYVYLKNILSKWQSN